RRRTRRKEEEEKEPSPSHLPKDRDNMPRESCTQPSKERTRVSDHHEHKVPASENLQTENSKVFIGPDLHSNSGGGARRIDCANPEISRRKISREVSSEGPSAEDHGRERLKRHRMEMAGRVWIPEIWGQERLLKDWIDCEAFDRFLVPKGLMLAREALMEDCRRANSGPLGIENRC
ncbi:putative protein BIC1-like, partial [Cocos nucifera]